jgi:UDP-N-acetylmuramoyl-L-alanyl-D-glutamate--2,6-diaminopimelate ligase
MSQTRDQSSTNGMPSSRVCPATLGALFDRACIVLPEGVRAETPISGFEDDSRGVRAGFLFVAAPGETVDGHRFIAQALSQGAAVVVAERIPEDVSADDATRIVLLPDTRQALGLLAHAFWGHPSRRLQVVGVTGTNGKTTTAYLVEGALRNLRRYPALLSTVVYRLGGENRDAPTTTPDALSLARMMALALERDADSVVMEVSSHALAQGRVEGVEFDVAAITNVTQDHLDYHGTMEAYAEVKRLLFTRHKPRVAVFNLDDPTSRAFAEEHSGAKVTFSIHARRGADLGADLFPVTLEVGPTGIQMEIVFRSKTASGALRSPLILKSPLRGRFNAENLMGAAAICSALGLAPEQVVAGLNGMPGAPGRFEAVRAGQPFDVFVDYAHTPDAVERLLENVRDAAQRSVIAVLGCGGDRDASKRPIMGAALGRLADYAIVTTDNPRTEAPEAIAQAMEEGIRTTAEPGGYEVCLDRREAIRRALERARPGDAVVVAGKGQETYQEVDGVRHHFDDRETVREVWAELARSMKE